MDEINFESGSYIFDPNDDKFVPYAEWKALHEARLRAMQIMFSRQEQNNDNSEL